MGLVPDEGKALPPPGILNRNSLWLGGMGWGSAILQNAIRHRPPLKSAGYDNSMSSYSKTLDGIKNVKEWVCAVTETAWYECVHRQFLMATIGWFVGYHLTKYENYTYARLDRDMNEYVKLHPEEFAVKEKKTFAEIVEPFYPVR